MILWQTRKNNKGTGEISCAFVPEPGRFRTEKSTYHFNTMRKYTLGILHHWYFLVSSLNNDNIPAYTDLRHQPLCNQPAPYSEQ